MYFFQPFCSEDDDVSNWSRIIIKYPYLQQMISIQMGVSKKFPFKSQRLPRLLLLIWFL